MENESGPVPRRSSHWRGLLLSMAVGLVIAIVVLLVLRSALNLNWLKSPYWTGIEGILAVLAFLIGIYEIVGRQKEHAPSPPPPPSDEVDVDVPPPPVGFVDREEVLADIETSLVTRGQSRVRAISIQGFGGLGKSSVAQKVVESLRLAHNNRFKVISWHQCDDIESDEGWSRLLDEVARRHGSATIATYDDVQAKEGVVTELLAKKESLLILDNVEERFPLARAMRVFTVEGVRHAESSLLITSRYALNHPNLQVKELDVLPMRDGQNLFLQRVESVSRGSVQGAVEIKESELDSVTHICHEVGYLPLGIELAAVIVGRRMATVPALAKQLGTSESADISDTFQKLYATFTASYEPLPVAHQYTFAALSLFEGADFALEAAQAVAQAARTLASVSDSGSLTALVDHSLVQNFQSQDEVRCRLHPLLKQFAQQKFREFSASVQYQLTRAVYDYYAARVSGTADYARALDRDYLNYAGAIRLAYEAQEWSTVVRLCGVMGNYWYVRGQWFEGRKYLEMGIMAGRYIGAKKEESQFLIELGTIAAEQGFVDEAKTLLRRALELLQQLATGSADTEIEYGIVDTLLQLGRLEDKQGNYVPAKEWFMECYQRAEKCQYKKVQASAAHELGVVSIHLLDYDGALTWLNMALNMRSANHDIRGVGRTNHQFGRLYNRRAAAANQIGDAKQAAEFTTLASNYLDRARAIALDEDDQRGYSHTLREIGILQKRIGMRDEARQTLTEALSIAHNLGDKLAEGQIHIELCLLALDVGNNEVAQQEALLGYSLLRAAKAKPEHDKVTELMLQHGWPVPAEVAAG